MKGTSTIRKFKVRTKHYLDSFRPYPWLTGFSPWPGWSAKNLGSVIHRDAHVQGRLRLFEPAWFQMNRHTFCRNISVPGRHFLYIGEGGRLTNRTIGTHTLVSKDNILEGKELNRKTLTLSVDFEGNTAQRPGNSSLSREIQEQAGRAAQIIYSHLKELKLNTTWYVVGSIVDDPLIRPVFEQILNDPLVEIGWHTQHHENYFLSPEDTAKRDMDFANRLRDEYQIDMSAISFPYNAVGHIGTVLSNEFTKLRGYIGQYFLPFTVLFENFSFLGSSLFLGPETVEQCSFALASHRSGALNVFMHPVDWVGKNLNPLMNFLNHWEKRVNH